MMNRGAEVSVQHCLYDSGLCGNEPEFNSKKSAGCGPYVGLVGEQHVHVRDSQILHKSTDLHNA